MINEFYSISPFNTEPIDEYQLENLGEEKIWASFGKNIRDGYGGTNYERNALYTAITPEDYDGALALKLIYFKPIYELDKLLDYHKGFYINNGGTVNKFLKHIRYVVLPYLTKHYANQKPCIELVEKWLSENEKTKYTMIEYNELSTLEKQAINGFIQSIPSNIRYSSPIWFYKKDIDDQIQDNVAHHSDRIIDFLLSNSFIKLRTHQPTYDFLEDGYKLLKYGSIEKFYEKITTQTTPSIIGNGNVVNIAGGSIHQTDVTITFTETHYEQLKSLGVEENKIEELKHIVIENKSDKPTLKTKAFKWLGEVSKAVATKGLTNNLPQITEFIGNLIN